MTSTLVSPSLFYDSHVDKTFFSLSVHEGNPLSELLVPPANDFPFEAKTFESSAWAPTDLLYFSWYRPTCSPSQIFLWSRVQALRCVGCLCFIPLYKNFFRIHAKELYFPWNLFWDFVQLYAEPNLLVDAAVGPVILVTRQFPSSLIIFIYDIDTSNHEYWIAL